MSATISLLGIDLGKRTFHVHGQDTAGHQVMRRQYHRAQLLQLLAQLPACTVAMEACAGAHWLADHARGFGHTVRLIDPRRVRPFVAGNKHDFADAQAICEAACRPSIRSIEPKTPEQLALAAVHRLREARVAERTACMNQAHGFLLEFGIALPTGHGAVRQLPALAADDAQRPLPALLRQALMALYDHYRYLSEQVRALDRQIEQALRTDETAARLLSVPGIGPVTASLICVEAGNARQYRSSRDFAASLGLAPRQHSTGGKTNMLGISKRGDAHLRWLLVQCARVVLQRLDRRDDALGQWARQLRLRRHPNVVACALAAKLARIVWAVLTRGNEYCSHPSAPAHA